MLRAAQATPARGTATRKLRTTKTIALHAAQLHPACGADART
ncbi:hypothetical protein A2U01_0046133, partial [Trifolium medium]|nr:hypothetical protein [Trifolium medium]